MISPAASPHGLHLRARGPAAVLLRAGRYIAAAIAVFALACQLAGDAVAQPWVVSVSTDDGLGDTQHTLSWAIQQANNAGGNQTITFDQSAAAFSGSNPTITLNGNLPPILCNLTINGSLIPGLTISGANHYAAFFVDSGTVSISNLSIVNTNAVGGAGGNTGGVNGGGGGGLGAGGALFVNSGANVTISKDVYKRQVMR